jgi:drug/metabolite transporter (DMT)-like permease
MRALRDSGVRAALLSAALFGVGTPLAGALLGATSPWLLAGLLYCGSGIGLGLIRLVGRARRVTLARGDRLPLAGAILFGGVAAPVLLMLGLSGMPSSGASLLLNSEGVFTALIAWFVFRENFDRRIALGMLAIVAGAVVLSVPTGAQLGSALPALAVLGACVCWGLDNNLTRRIATPDATWLATVKGCVAGPVNLGLALALGAHLPAPGVVLAAMAVGFVAYGVSLVLFIGAMRRLGTARAGAYFSVAPFFGAVVAVGFGDPVTVTLLVAAVLMALGIGLHLTERHEHSHTHEPLVHDHWHTHDSHHQHDHDHRSGTEVRHRHPHTHEAVRHAHEHYPDVHHRHSH